jgi:hypothetical protein
MPPARIRSHNPSRRMSADLRLRPLGHWYVGQPTALVTTIREEHSAPTEETAGWTPQVVWRLKGPSALVTEQCGRHPVTELVTMFCSGLVRRDVGICPSHQRDVTVRPEQVWTVRRTQTRNITAPVSTHKLNGFQIKMYSVFNTVSEWFMMNSLSLNLNKKFHGIKVCRMHKYVIRIIMSCKKKKKENRVGTYSEN